MTTSNYERDFFAWSQEQAGLLRTRRYDALDIDHLLEELESMGARERRELVNRLKILLAHLLEWQLQPQRQSRGRAATIEEQRLSIEDLLDENPSMRGILDRQITKAYRLARLLAVKETDPDEARFPEVCPFSLNEISDPDYLPVPTGRSTSDGKVPSGKR